MSPQARDDREGRFAGFLTGLAARENRAALAALRRGLSADRSASASMYPYVAGWVTDKDTDWNEECFYLVAALFGRHPKGDSAGGDFGWSCRELQEETGGESFERRFVALLASDPAGVGVHLRHAMSLAASKNIAVDWSQLLRDLEQWGHPQRFVQRRWARSFWRQTDNGKQAENPTPDSNEESEVIPQQ